MTLMTIAMALISCGGGNAGSAEGLDVPAEIKVGDITIEMVDIAPATFAMGLTPAGVKATGATIHQVILSGYSISKKPVSQALWKEVMGSNPSPIEDLNAPVSRVTYKECEKFVSKLSRITGIPFSIPTEAQWEYAVVSGKSESVAKHSEWCADSFVEDLSMNLQTNPIVKTKGDNMVVRNPKERVAAGNYAKAPLLTFRVVVNTNVTIPDIITDTYVNRVINREEVSQTQDFEVNGVKFRMLAVNGGTFSMGATPEQGKSAGEDELPVHDVTLKGFSIGQTEVTVGLWKAVMGTLPYRNDVKEPQKPVVNVSWYDCQTFILKLNELTGRKFRLPTEAEWEFAARGGNISNNTNMAGSAYPSLVAAYVKNASSEVQNVKSYQPNEIGAFDMSGNAWEWCQDAYTPYSGAAVTDPYVNVGDKMVMRGGSAASQWDACRVSNRSGIPPSTMKSTFGLRLAL